MASGLKYSSLDLTGCVQYNIVETAIGGIVPALQFNITPDAVFTSIAAWSFAKPEDILDNQPIYIDFYYSFPSSGIQSFWKIHYNALKNSTTPLYGTSNVVNILGPANPSQINTTTATFSIPANYVASGTAFSVALESVATGELPYSNFKVHAVEVVYSGQNDRFGNSIP